YHREFLESTGISQVTTSKNSLSSVSQVSYFTGLAVGVQIVETANSVSWERFVGNSTEIAELRGRVKISGLDKIFICGKLDGTYFC
ncbi:MAG: hypothetical protein LBU65_12640, partial [Planctomycetaceae bacterium]|nr:hypothetical protein [Planctomycetaceae bacterium]